MLKFTKIPSFLFDNFKFYAVFSFICIFIDEFFDLFKNESNAIFKKKIEN